MIIVVGVVIETMKQIESHLLMRNYQGFIGNEACTITLNLNANRTNAHCRTVVAEVLQTLSSHPSRITTAELDKIAEGIFVRLTVSLPLGYHNFSSICTSVNEEVVHGIPSLRRLKKAI